MEPVFYDGWREDFESGCDVASIETHCALVFSNLAEFGNSGYDAMGDMCDNDHEIIWFREDCIFLAKMFMGVAYLREWVTPFSKSISARDVGHRPYPPNHTPEAA